VPEILIICGDHYDVTLTPLLKTPLQDLHGLV
jgi:hypothetical protein